MPSSYRICRCVSLHTYPAVVTADSWHVMVHLCRCGREHFNEPLIPPTDTPTRAAAKRRPKRTRKKR